MLLSLLFMNSCVVSFDKEFHGPKKRIHKKPEGSTAASSSQADKYEDMVLLAVLVAAAYASFRNSHPERDGAVPSLIAQLQGGKLMGFKTYYTLSIGCFLDQMAIYGQIHRLFFCQVKRESLQVSEETQKMWKQWKDSRLAEHHDAMVQRASHKRNQLLHELRQKETQAGRQIERDGNSSGNGEDDIKWYYIVSLSLQKIQ